MRRVLRLWVAAGVALSSPSLLGCGSSSSPPLLGSGDDLATPSNADLVAFSRLSNAMPVDMAVSSSRAYGIVDTGDPWLLLDPAAFPSVSGFGSGGGTLASLSAGGISETNVFAISSATGNVSEGTGFTLHGNLGCSVLCGQVASFDYRAVSFALGSTSAPSDLGATVSVDFTLEGGGSVGGIATPASRILVPVTIEGGAVLTMMIDTGASSVTLTQAAYDTIVADGRMQATGEMDETTSGSSTSSSTRVKTITLGGATVNGALVSHDTSFDQNLAQVSDDVGHTVDGSLGGTFLRNFYVTVDYPNLKLGLAPYPSLDFLVDPYEAIGIGFAGDGTSSTYVVASTTATAAALGVTAGDVVTAIDGTELSSLDYLQAPLLFYGPVGSTRLVTFGKAATLSGQSIAVPVEEFLPLTTTTK